MKKVSSILFTLLANLVLMAHVVIPHHHHEEEICIESSHCETDHKETHHHNSTTHSHKHDGEHETQHCVWEQVIIAPVKQVRQGNFEKEIKSYTISGVTSDKEYAGNTAVLFTKNYPLVIPPPCSRFVSSGLGLRAPPHV